jgi:hypothetical protein
MTDVCHRTVLACNGMMTWKSEYFLIPGWSHYCLTGTHDPIFFDWQNIAFFRLFLPLIAYFLPFSA